MDNRRRKTMESHSQVGPAMAGLTALVLMAGCAGSTGEPVEIRFAAEVAGVAAQCGTLYDGVGTLGAPVELADARLYVSNLRLRTSDGREVAIELDQESPWQHGGAALLDFEDGSGRCSDSGTRQTNSVVRGTIPAGEYTGLSFDIGVPVELNHLDALAAPSPLNLNALYWNWRMGYIFNKVELWNADPPDSADPAEPIGEAGASGQGEGSAVEPLESPTVTYLAHLGSTGCESSAPTTAPTEPCSRPNRAKVVLNDFRPATHEVRLDLAGLVDGIDITRSVPRPPGCMSSPTDPDCRQVFANLGLDLETGRCFTDCSDQKVAYSRRVGGDP